MKKTKLITAFAAATAAFALSANAASIGVNVGASGFDLTSTTSAGVEAQTNWNNLTGGNVGATAVNDSSGTLLATTVQVQTSWSYTTGAGTSDGNHSLMHTALDNSGGEMGFVVTGIPYAVYDVIIYHEGGSDAGRGGPFFIRDTDGGNSIIASQVSYDISTFSGTFVDGGTVGTVPGTGIDDNGTPGDPSDDFVVNSNYVRFNGLSLANIGIRSDAANPLGIATDRAAIAGMQIIEVVEVVPEPSTTALLGLGGLALILRRRK